GCTAMGKRARRECPNGVGRFGVGLAGGIRSSMFGPAMRWRGNWFLAFCFLVIVGCVAWALGPDFIAALRSYAWRPTPCLILKSEVAQEPFSRTVTHFVLRVEYSYTFQGQEYRSRRFTTGDRQGSTDVSKAERAAIRFAPGARAVCYVNPRDPS